MFKKTYLKLAGFYLLVLAVISFVFSVNIYQLSVDEIENDLKLHSSRLDRFNMPNYAKSAFLQEANNQYIEAKGRILLRLTVVNLFVIAVGGLLSYYLARWTLRPIENTHRSLERFTADASHELRTPIAAMQTETEVTLMNPQLTLEEAKDQLESNLEELHKLTGLTDMLLQVARYNEYEAMNFELIDLRDLIDGALNKIDAMAKNKNIKIIYKKSSDAIMVNVDPASIEQAIIIILENAIKYSTKGKQVTVNTRVSGQEAVVEIKDNGKGISKENMKHIFDRFYRADVSRSKEGQKGYGLGLSIAKSILSKNEGTICVDSVEGVGSSFKVILKKAQ
jgi:two-component system sensor histidine kinase CiaH